MAAATARGRKTQKAGAPTPAPATYISSNNAEYTLDTYRVQRLITAAGVSPRVASLVAPLAFGGAA